MDFVVGRVTREHSGVDFFVDHRYLDAVVADLVFNGWIVRNPARAHIQAHLSRRRVDLYLTPIAHRDLHRPHVPVGPWAGTPWPDTALTDAHDVTLGGVGAKCISVDAQIECKERIPGWTGRAVRDKDLADLVVLRGLSRDMNRVEYSASQGDVTTCQTSAAGAVVAAGEYA